VDTIGGLVMQAFGHLPARGESIDIDGYQFKVAMADSRRIIQVHVKLPDDAHGRSWKINYGTINLNGICLSSNASAYVLLARYSEPAERWLFPYDIWPAAIFR
jgi:hypothetical protein